MVGWSLTPESTEVSINSRGWLGKTLAKASLVALTLTGLWEAMTTFTKDSVAGIL